LAYLKALSAYGAASSVVYRHVFDDTDPTATDIQRRDDARVMLKAARAAYFAARMN
jgi:hypothetical protein